MINNIGLLIGLGIFLLVGLIFLGIAFYIAKIHYKDCNVEMKATCKKVKHNKRNKNRDDITHCPVYEIYYNGQEMTVCNNVYTKGTTPKVGDIRTIYINPNNPNKYYEVKQNRLIVIFISIIGISCIIPFIVVILKMFI
jgi:hypothetical protein